MHIHIDQRIKVVDCDGMKDGVESASARRVNLLLHWEICVQPNPFTNPIAIVVGIEFICFGIRPCPDPHFATEPVVTACLTDQVVGRNKLKPTAKHGW